MSASSGFGPCSAVTSTGSSAMPQIGHDPGSGCRISGCIGQVYSSAWPWAAAGPGASAASMKASGCASNRTWQCAEQK